METRGRKKRHSGVGQVTRRRTPEQDERYWERLRSEFAAGTYPNSGAYGQQPKATAASIAREIEQCDLAMRRLKYADRLMKA